MCLSQEPDGRESDRETPREEGRGKARDGGRKMGTEKRNWRGRCGVGGGSSHSLLVDDDELL